jgi:lysyl-tRNA synthetase class 2
LAARARLLAKIREFFAQRGVLEVETPLLNPTGTTDPNIESFTTMSTGSLLYLHTSPEFAMKRLLAAGSGPIYQICKVFRAEEQGRYHHPEFTLLEWYRLGMDHHALMNEVADLFAALGVPVSTRRRSYADVFNARVGLNPHTASDEALREWINSTVGSGESTPPLLVDRAQLVDYVFGFYVVPELGRDGPEFVFDFPVEQAALARIRPGCPPVAERFELFWSGVELANGFYELTEAEEQRLRFTTDNEKRRKRGQSEIAFDHRLIRALDSGLPTCAGVAIGLDRLLMLSENEKSLAGATLPFTSDLV